MKKLLIEQITWNASNSDFDLKIYVVDEKCFNIEDFNNCDPLNDCEVNVYSYETGGILKKIENHFFRYHEEDLPDADVVLSATYKPYGQWQFKITINGKTYIKLVDNEDIYERYKSGVYSDLEFVYIFFPELIEDVLATE